MPQHYTNQIVNPLTIQYVGPTGVYFQGAPLNRNPFLYEGPANLLVELLNSGLYQIVSGASTLSIATTDQVPGAAVDTNEDNYIERLISLYKPASPHILASDNFNGTARTVLGRSVTGQVWQPSNFIGGSNGTQAVATYNHSGHTYLETHAADGSLKATMVDNSGFTWLTFRASRDGQQFFFLFNTGGDLRLGYYPADFGGSTPTLATATGAGGPNTQVQIDLLGSNIKVYINGNTTTPVIDYTNNNPAYSNTNTRHGFGSYSANGLLLDDFSFTGISDGGFNQNLPLVIWDGNSIVTGLKATSPANSMPGQTMASLGGYNAFNWYNFGKSGINLAQVVDYAPNTVDLILADYPASSTVVVLYELTNAIAAGFTAAQIHDNLLTYLNARQQAGAQVILSTCMPCIQFNTAQETIRQTVNSDILSNLVLFAEGIANFAGNANLSDATNTTYFSDGTHPTDVGYAVMASIVKPVIQGLV